MVVENFPANLFHALSPRATGTERAFWPRVIVCLACMVLVLLTNKAYAEPCSGHVYGSPPRSRPGGIEGRLGYYQPILPTRPLYAPPSVMPGWQAGYQAGFHDGRHASRGGDGGHASRWGADRFRPSHRYGYPGRAREGFAWRQGDRD